MLRRLLPALLTLALTGGALSTGGSAAAAAGSASAGSGSAGESFVVASFNVLGADHTDGKRGRAGFEDSTVRMNRAIKILRRTHVDVVGFQELQDPQYEHFLDKVGDRWAVWTGGSWDTDNSIAWRTDRFELVQGWSVDVPYFHGNMRPMPVVELRSLATGRPMFVMNTHNPADVRGDAEKWRDEAMRTQRNLARRLTYDEHAPVFLTGDLNAREDFFCPFTRNGVMRSFIGGAHPKGGACRPPKSGVDWIFANRYVHFGTPRIDRSPLVEATTDHPVVSSPVTLRAD